MGNKRENECRGGNRAERYTWEAFFRWIGNAEQEIKAVTVALRYPLGEQIMAVQDNIVVDPL